MMIFAYQILLIYKQKIDSELEKYDRCESRYKGVLSGLSKSNVTIT